MRKRSVLELLLREDRNLSSSAPNDGPGVRDRPVPKVSIHLNSQLYLAAHKFEIIFLFPEHCSPDQTEESAHST